MVTPVDKYLREVEAPEIGGVLVNFWADQGAGKTTALWVLVKKDVEDGRIPLWRGQESCQWIGVASQKADGERVPVTLWIHDTIKDYEFTLTGSLAEGIKPQEIDIEEMEGTDIQIKSFNDAEALVNEKLDSERANVVYIPGGKSPDKVERYFFYKTWSEIFEALNHRPWRDHVTLNLDEAPDLLTSEQQKPFYELVKFVMPNQWGNFRKNKVSARTTGHHKSEMFHRFRKKSNEDVYMQGAKVDSGNQVDQGAVNSLDRREYIIPGFQRGYFKKALMPDNLPWMSSHEDVKLKMEWTAEIPDITPEDTTKEDYLDDKPFQEKHLEDLMDVEELAEEMDITKRAARRKLKRGDLRAIKVEDKWFSSITELVNTEEVPK